MLISVHKSEGRVSDSEWEEDEEESVISESEEEEREGGSSEGSIGSSD